MRQIDQLIDEGLFDVDSIFDLYSGRGSAPHDPKLLVKLAVFEHCRGRTAPIQWYRDLSNDNEVQWLTLGMSVSKTALYNFRDRVAPLLKPWNEQLVTVAIQEDLVDGSSASLDGTTVAANAARRKLVNMRQIERRLALLEQALASDVPLHWTITTLDESLQPGWMAPTMSGKQEQYQRYLKVRQRLETMAEENSRRRKDKQKPVDKIVVSLNDPESIFGLDKEKTYRPLYNVQAVTDLGTDVVLAYDVLSQHSDSGTLQPMVDACIAVGASVAMLFVDAGYPTGEDLAFCEQRGITLYAPWQENSFTKAKKQENSNKAEARIEKSQFDWNAENNDYVCPNGKPLAFSRPSTRQRADGKWVPFEIYQASPEDCLACPLQSRCTTVPQKGRTVRRDAHQDQIDALQARMQTVEAKLLYSKRGQTIERVFGDFKEHRNLRRFRGRGLQRARAQVGFTVLGHNLRTLHKLRNSKSSEVRNDFPQKTAA